jgi:hypothetical protein
MPLRLPMISAAARADVVGQQLCGQQQQQQQR